jgi:hypothetical protein
MGENETAHESVLRRGVGACPRLAVFLDLMEKINNYLNI